MVLQDGGVEEGYWASGAPYRLGNSQAVSFWGSEGSQPAHTGVRGHPSAQVGAEVLGKEAPKDGGPVAPLLGPLGGAFRGDSGRASLGSVLASGTLSVHRMRVLGWPVAYTVPHLEDLGGTWFCPLN